MIRSELGRLYRGLIYMREALGWQLVAAIAGTFGLLLVAVLYIHGALAAVLVLLLGLVALRAHDLGELPPLPKPPDEPTEYSTFWSDDTEQAARRDDVEFLHRRHSVALGRPHEPSEL